MSSRAQEFRTLSSNGSGHHEPSRSARAAFVDHPIGRTFGPPHDRQRNETVLAKAPSQFSRFTGSGVKAN